MVNRILKAESTLASNTVAELVAEFSPREGHSYEILELWTAGNANVAVSLNVHERALFSSIPSDALPDAGQGLVFDLQVRAGENLQVLADELAGAENDVAVYLLINETGPNVRG